MASTNILGRLEKVSKDLSAIRRSMNEHPISAKEAREIDNEATSICAQGATIASTARVLEGNRYALKLVQRVRKALGFTYP
jgi:hypothetical protein